VLDGPAEAAAVVDQGFPSPGNNKVVWMFWGQGLQKVPAFERACFASWKRMAPGWEVRLIDQQNMRDWVTEEEANLVMMVGGKVRWALASDLLRLMLLRTHGGVWADISVVLTRPLDKWLPQRMEGAMVFAFDYPDHSSTAELYSQAPWIESWFLAARPGSRFVSSWLKQTVLFSGDVDPAPESPHFSSRVSLHMENDENNDPKSRPSRECAYLTHKFVHLDKGAADFAEGSACMYWVVYYASSFVLQTHPDALRFFRLKRTDATRETNAGEWANPREMMLRHMSRNASTLDSAPPLMMKFTHTDLKELELERVSRGVANVAELVEPDSLLARILPELV